MYDYTNKYEISYQLTKLPQRLPAPSTLDFLTLMQDIIFVETLRDPLTMN